MCFCHIQRRGDAGEFTIQSGLVGGKQSCDCACSNQIREGLLHGLISCVETGIVKATQTMIVEPCVPAGTRNLAIVPGLMPDGYAAESVTSTP